MTGIGNLIVVIGTLVGMGLIALVTIAINIGIVILVAMFAKYVTKLIYKDIKAHLFNKDKAQ